jgi:predicted O-linked N-acetylglucosamine transferase (SPINDLY family)
MASSHSQIEHAIALHQAGRLAEADQLYSQVLQANPRNSDALHMLGLLAHQVGRHDLAVERIRQAITIQPSHPGYYNNLGEVFRLSGRAAEARASYEQALRLNPQLVAAHYNLGLLLGATDRPAARRHYEQAIRLQPNHAAAHNNLGNLLRELGENEAALAAFRASLQADPNYAEALSNLGALELDRQQTAEAVEHFELACRLRPESAELRFNLGNAHKAAQDLGKAVDCYREALRLKPDFVQAQCNLAAALRVLGDHEAATSAYLAVLQRDPQHVDALIGYGNVLQDVGQHDAALEQFNRAAGLRPDSAIAHFNRGCVLMFQRERNEAVAAFLEALRLEPNYPQAYANLAVIYNDSAMPDTALEYCQRGLALGGTFGELYANMALSLHAQGKGLEAIDYYRKSLDFRPDKASEHSNLIYAMNFLSQFDADALYREHLAWAERHAEPLTAQTTAPRTDPAPNRRLRVGYVSCHFRDHAVNFFVEPILTAHDHEQFEVYCYSSVQRPDAATERLQAAVDVWRDVSYTSDEELAKIVRDDRIDILVDLNGHMGWNRLPTFARRPAPVQVTYIGYQNTTGMSAMDYRLTDDWADPPGLTDAHYTEQLWRLPRAFFCYQPFETPASSSLPFSQNGHLTFGSFNNFAKVGPEVIDAWLEILSRVPQSRLIVLAYRGGYLERHFHELAGLRGIDADRIELFGKCWRKDYLQQVARADIALDPFPFNGHTTTCDAIWMGVPVVMQAGQTYVSRFGGSVLRNVGLDDLIAASTDDYIGRAVTLAGDVDRLTSLRGELRPRMAASPLLDFVGFTRNLEQAYREMWQRWCASATADPSSTAPG